MRRLVAAIVVVGLALSLAGCSSGGSTASSTTTPAGAVPVPAAGSSTTLPALTNRSANETSTFEPFPTDKDVPADLNQKITIEKQPTLIYFYDSSQNTSKEVRSMIDSVRSDNRGLVDLVAYDIGKYLSVDANGVESVDPALSSDATAAAAVKLARDPSINVNFTPYIVLTDGQGYIIYKHTGLVDRTMLEREVLRASR